MTKYGMERDVCITAGDPKPFSVMVFLHQGYYMQSEVFGAKGDFITSPEVSQVFGEVCAGV